jgi:hypothetical protein
MATIPANNNTGLYNTSGVPATTGNDLTVTGNVNANNVNAVNTVNAGTNVNATANVNAGSYINASYGTITNDLTVGGTIYGTFSGNISGNLVVPGSNTQVLFNNSGNAGASADFTFNDATNILDVNGNVVADYFIGDGSLLTGLPATYSNANVNAHLAAFGSNTIVTTGNITGGYFVGNGSLLTGITGTGNYSNSNVVSLLSAFGSNTIVTTGNVTGGNFIGSGAALTSLTGANVTGTVANATYATSAGTATSANSVAGANVTGTVALANAATYAGTVTTAAQPNITSVGTLTSLSTSGNVNVGGSLNTDDVTSTGNVTIFGNQVITGNLTVQGTTTTINSNTITTNDKTITVANNQSTGANVDGAGLEAGNPAVATWLYNDASQTWRSSIGISAVGNITGSYIFGNGSQLTGLPATYSNSNVTTLLAAFGSNTISTSGNITGGNITGNGQSLTNLPGANVVGAVANATYAVSAGSATTAGTVTTNAQPNITSVGTLTSLSVSGNTSTGGILTDGYYYANGTPVTFGGTYGNANVADFLANGFGSNTVTTTGNVTAGTFRSTNFQATSSAGGALKNASGTTQLQWGAGGGNNLTVDVAIDINPANARVAISPTGSGYVQMAPATTGSINNMVIGNTTAAAASFTTVSASGNITTSGGQFTGSGAGLSSIPGGNVTGTVANATFATSAGTATTATTAGTVTTNAQPNITSVGTLTSLSVSGNTTTANLNLSGQIYDSSGVLQLNGSGNIVLVPVGSTVMYGNADVIGNVAAGNIAVTGGITAGGNIAGNFILGNGSQLTGIVSTYGNANVANFLSNFGSNVIVTTGNITAGNVTTTGAAGNITGANYVTANFFVGNGSLLTGVTATSNYNNSNVATFLAAFGSNTISTTGNVSAGNLIATGTARAGAVTYTGTDGTNGQVLTTYGNGVTYFSTVSGGGSPGGANTQIQFNNAGAFAGNAALTFNNVSGNIGLGNLIVNAQQIQTVSAPGIASFANITPNPARVVLGTGFNGNISPAFDINSNGRGARFLVSDSISTNDSNAVSRGIQVQNFYTLTGNITGANIRLGGGGMGIAIGGGSGANTITGPTSATGVSGLNGAVIIGGGTSGNLTSLGNTTVQYATAMIGALTINAGSTGGNIFGVTSLLNNSGTANTVVGFSPILLGTGTYSNVYGYYMPGAATQIIGGSSNVARNATNYYAIRNDDDVSQVKLGSLRLFHEFQFALTSSGGALTVDKNNGQVQFLTVSENITSVSFSNFVTTASTGTTNKRQADTVTLIVQQDATGRSITLPAASSVFKYAGGSNTVPATANSVSMISITAIYNTVTAADQYLITISPEFS